MDLSVNQGKKPEVSRKVKNQILNLFSDPEKWNGIKAECIALKCGLDVSAVKEVLDSDERIEAETLRKWQYHLVFMREVFGVKGIAKKFGISEERVLQIMKEEGL